MSKVTTPKSPPEEEEDIQPEEISKKSMHLTWTDQIESLLSGWADTAAVYKWLHDKSHRKYKRKNKYLSIPTMVLSLITGSLGIGLQGYVPAEYMSIGQGALGGMGIFIGILQGLQTQFGWAQRSEKHLASCLGWGKLQRNIQIELAVEREFRKDADSFVKVCRMEYDRLTEQSPAIPSDVLEFFKQMFKNKDKKEEKGEDDDLVLPDICDSIKHTKVYKAAINNPESIIPNLYNNDDKNKEIDLQKELTEKIVKSAFNERIKELEEKASGITQFKLASMGNKYIPLVSQFQHQHHHQQNTERKYSGSSLHPIFNTMPHKRPSHIIKPLHIDPENKKPAADLIGVDRPSIKSLINKFKTPEFKPLEEPVKTPRQEEPPKEEQKQDESIKEEQKDNETIVIINPIIEPENVEIKIDKPEIPPLDLEQIKKEEEEKQNASNRQNSKRKKSPMLVFKDED